MLAGRHVHAPVQPERGLTNGPDFPEKRGAIVLIQEHRAGSVPWIRRVRLDTRSRAYDANSRSFGIRRQETAQTHVAGARAKKQFDQRQLVSLVQVLLNAASTLGQATTSMGEDKLKKKLSAGHIGEDWMDSDAFCELQPIIGLTSRYDRFDEWENEEHRNLIPAEPAKSTLGGLILLELSSYGWRLGSHGRLDRWQKNIENHVQPHSVLEHHTAHIPLLRNASAKLKKLSATLCLNEADNEFLVESTRSLLKPWDSMSFGWSGTGREKAIDVKTLLKVQPLSRVEYVSQRGS